MPMFGELGGVVLSIIDLRSIILTHWSSTSFETNVAISPEQILTSCKNLMISLILRFAVRQKHFMTFKCVHHKSLTLTNGMKICDASSSELKTDNIFTTSGKIFVFWQSKNITFFLCRKAWLQQSVTESCYLPPSKSFVFYPWCMSHLRSPVVVSKNALWTETLYRSNCPANPSISRECWYLWINVSFY